MRANLLTIPLITAALAGCAGDNPDNVPEYGQWAIDTKLSSLTVDGLMVPASDLPQEMLALNKSEDRCGEPMFIDRDWQQADINRRVRGKCTLQRYNVNPTTVTGSGKCEEIAAGVDFAPEFDLAITQAPQSYRMRLTIKGMADLPDGTTRYISAVAVQEGKRTGDCN